MQETDCYPGKQYAKIPLSPEGPDHVGAFSTIYDTFWAPLVHVATSYALDADEGKEMAQVVMVSLLLKGVQINDPSRVFAYLCRAVRNRLINERRNRNNRRRILYELQEGAVTAQVSSVGHQYNGELQRLIRGCLQGLPERYAKVFLLFWEQELTVPQIARQLNRPQSTVEKHLQQARRHLRKVIDPERLLTDM